MNKKYYHSGKSEEVSSEIIDLRDLVNYMAKSRTLEDTILALEANLTEYNGGQYGQT